MTPAIKPDRMGILLRVGLFILIGWLGTVIFSFLMYTVAGIGIFATSAMSTFAAAAVANAITVRVYERGRLSDLGLGWTATSKREMFLGFAAAAGAAVVILGGPLATGFAHFEPSPGVEHPWASFLFVSLVLLFGAAGEEMLFRGYAFQLLVRSIGPFATILPVSFLFGLAHLGNLNSTLLGVINTALWGILLGFAYWRTNALWLPIGLHFGWNFTLPLFGVNLSGFTMGVTGYALHWRTGDLVSGGAYGPEGSVLASGIVVALFFVIQRAFPELPEE
jgi:membrane protease YdiL (CAAX protease family)